MADEAGIAALKSGKDEWNKYAAKFVKDFPNQPFDLTDANLEGVNFDSIEFGRRAQFDGSLFKDVYFSSTRFDQGASFVGCAFQGTTRLYDWMSMYAQSVLRPLWVYLGIHLIFAGIYSLLSGQRWEAIDARLTSLTLYGAIPFAAALRWPEVSGASGDVLFPQGNLFYVQIAIVFQSILSAILLFLIGLGFRNMFKIR